MTQRNVITSIRIELRYEFTFSFAEVVKPKPTTDAFENFVNDHQEYPRYIEWEGSIHKRTVPFLCIGEN